MVISAVLARNRFLAESQIDLLVAKMLQNDRAACFSAVNLGGASMRAAIWLVSLQLLLKILYSLEPWLACIKTKVSGEILQSSVLTRFTYLVRLHVQLSCIIFS
jgi:hypothetical protein